MCLLWSQVRGDGGRKGPRPPAQNMEAALRQARVALRAEGRVRLSGVPAPPSPKPTEVCRVWRGTGDERFRDGKFGSIGRCLLDRVVGGEITPHILGFHGLVTSNTRFSNDANY